MTTSWRPCGSDAVPTYATANGGPSSSGLLIRGGDAAAREFARFAADMVKQFQQSEKAVTWAIAYDQGQAPAYAPLDSGSWRLLPMPDELADRIYQEYACGVYGIAND